VTKVSNAGGRVAARTAGPERSEMKGSAESAVLSAARWRRVAVVGVLVGGAFAAAVAFGVARAWATPGSGIVGGPIVARGGVGQDVVIGVPTTATVTKRVRVRVGKKTVTKRVSFRVATVRPLMRCAAASACDTAFQQLTIGPGGYTGWHTHPGPTFVAVAQGEGTLYHGIADCPSHKYGVGSAFFQPTTEVHNLRNESSSPLVVYAFYALPPGTPNTAIRTDQPQPASCPSIP
jgi:mannose-6-phosphate isomerase-like protein (cupin superfamily)